MNETFWKIFWSVVGAILTTIATWITTKVTKYYDARKKEIETSKNNFLIEEVVRNAVISIKQTYVDGLKIKGQFTSEKALEIKEMAVQMVKEQLSTKLLKYLDDTYEDSLGYIKNLIEKEVVRIKDEEYYRACK